jgi:hypothetical protein
MTGTELIVLVLVYNHVVWSLMCEDLQRVPGRPGSLFFLDAQ